MSGPSDHKRTVRDAFTEQAPAYAANAALRDEERVDRLVRAVAPGPGARTLEVATGPGHVAFGFAESCADVVAVDLTAAPLAIGEERRRDRGVENVHFQQGDAERLPYATDAFDVVVCRLAVHHFETPGRVLDEMARVCRPGGTVAVADLVVSEFDDRAAYQNRFERLRDPSHVRALPLTELLALLTATGVEVDTVLTGVLEQAVDDWLATARTPDDRAAEVRAMLERDAREDRSGTHPFRRDGDLYFVQRTAIVAGTLRE